MQLKLHDCCFALAIRSSSSISKDKQEAISLIEDVASFHFMKKPSSSRWEFFAKEFDQCHIKVFLMFCRDDSARKKRQNSGITARSPNGIETENNAKKTPRGDPMNFRLSTAIVACVSMFASVASAAPLADRHVAHGVGCDKCHTQVPQIDTNRCLQCHGGAEKLIARNPVHASIKDGKVACTACHKGHKE